MEKNKAVLKEWRGKKRVKENNVRKGMKALMNEWRRKCKKNRTVMLVQVYFV